MDRKRIPIEISARHVHLTQEDWAALFGSEKMEERTPLSQKPNFAAVQRATLQGPKGKLERVAIVGPCRPYTQAEISLTDARTLGITPPLSDSGLLDGAAEVTLIGPASTVTRKAAIIQKRHVHASPDEAATLGVQKNQTVSVRVGGERGAVLDHVLVRVHPSFSLALHLDTDEGNALGIQPGMTAELV